MLKKSDSFSRKGFGNGFISKNDRFKHNEFSQAYSYIPGPGSYTASTHAESLMGSSMMSKFTDKYKTKNLSSVFMPPTKVQSTLLAKKEETPGPGAYDGILRNPGTLAQVGVEKPAALSVFKSTTGKSTYLHQNKDTKVFPCPG